MSSRLPTRKSARIAIKQSLEDVSVPDSATNKTKRSAIKRAKKNKTKHVYQNEEDKRWEEQYSLLRKYHAKHGNTEVPGNYKVGNKKLGSWVYRQRTLYRLKRLQPERKQRLDSIDFRLTDKTTKAGSVRAKAATKTSAKPGTVSNLSRLPVSIKGAFGKIGFAKFGKKGITPVYFLSPFDLRQDSYPRNQWLETYQKVNCFVFLQFLVYGCLTMLAVLTHILLLLSLVSSTRRVDCVTCLILFTGMAKNQKAGAMVLFPEPRPLCMTRQKDNSVLSRNSMNHSVKRFLQSQH